MKQLLSYIFSFFRRLVIVLFFFGVFLFVSVSALTQIPTIQAFLIIKTTGFIGNYVNYPIKIGGVHFSWFNQIVLTDVLIKDTKQKEMIKVPRLVATFKLSKLLHRDVQIEKAEAFDPVVNLYYDASIQDVNIAHFIFSLMDIGVDTTMPKRPHVGKYAEFTIAEVQLHNGTCTYDDPAYSKYTDRFDFTHFKLRNINIEGANLKIVADTFSMLVQKLNAIDDFSGLKLHKATMQFAVCENFLEMNQLHANLGTSTLSNFVRFEYSKFRQLGYLTDSVFMHIHAQDAVLNAADLEVFFPQLKGFSDQWQATGTMKGKVRDFEIENVKASFGTTSTFNGGGYIKGLPSWNNCSLDLKIQSANVAMPDVIKYGIPEKANILPVSQLKGTFKGTPSQFIFSGSLNSSIGGADFELNMTLPENRNKISYRALLHTHHLDIGYLSKIPNLGAITGIAKISVKGSEFNQIQIMLNSQINQLVYKNYTYHNGLVNLYLNKQHLKASVDLHDSAIVLGCIFKAFLNPRSGYIDASGKLQKANLKKLHFMPKWVSLAADFNLHTNYVNNLDSLRGNCSIKNIETSDSIFSIVIPSIKASLLNQDNGQVFELRSDIVDMDCYGQFGAQKTAIFLEEFTNDLKTTWTNNDSTTSTYYKRKSILNTMLAEFDLKLKKSKKFMHIFMPGFILSDNARVSGLLQADSLMRLQCTLEADTLNFATIGWVETQLKFDFQKNRTDNQITADAACTSKYQLVNNNSFISTEMLDFEATWANQVVEFDIGLKQYNESNQAYATGNFTFWGNQKRLKFMTTDFKLLDKKWRLDDGNLIMFNDSKWSFKDVILSNGDQKVSLIGSLSQNENDVAAIQVENFKLRNFNKLININTDGDVNGYIIIKDVYSSPKVYSQLQITDFKLKKLLIGNAKGTSQWDAQHKRLLVGFDIEKDHQKVLDLNGSYYPKALPGKENLDITVHLNGASMVLFEPLVDGVISDLNGKMDGTISLKGGLSKPKIEGIISVSEGTAKVNYLNTTYTFDDKINITPESIRFNNVVLTDPDGNMGIIDGSINHSNYKSFNFKLSGMFKNARILDQPRTDSSLYYGTAFGTGTFSMQGTFEHFFIKIDASSDAGTRLYVPINNDNQVQRNEFITFAKKGGKKELNQILRVQKPKINQDNFTIEMDFNFDFTPEAYCELLLDPISGDKISGYGNGKINMQIHTDGDFSLLGNYTFEKESYYVFSLFNSISKRFSIQQGSRVVFNGDPYQAQLDVSASYDDRVPLHTLIPDTSLWRAPGIRTPYPVSTYMYLKGPMLKPIITYDIKITNYPSVVGGVPLFNYVTAFENRIRNSENEMGYQVMGLLLFRRFLNQNTGLDAAVGGTVSEVLTSHLSNVISKVDKNLSVDVNMNGLNRDAFNAMQVRVSYTLLDGKVRVTRSTSNVQNQSATSSVIGDWTVEYMLTDDGRFRAKGFNRNNPNPLATGTSNASNMSAGASLMHTASFNSLNPFQKRKKNKKLPTDTTKILP